MKTRIVVHIALDKNNKKLCNLVEVAGRLIPFDGAPDNDDANRKTSFWFIKWHTEESVSSWKRSIIKSYGAIRFQRLIVDGETL